MFMSTLRSRIQSWRSAERGFSSAAIFILALPLLVGAMGYGFDNSRFLYVKTYLQGRADLATQAALSNVGMSGSQILIDGSALQTASDLYCANTASKRGSSGMLSNSCQPSVFVVGSPLNNSQFCTRLSASSGYGLQLVTQEHVPTVFMKLIGIHELVISQLKSQALLRARSC
jgi:hypothetical protein